MDYCSLTRDWVAIRLFSISSNRWNNSHFTSSSTNSNCLQTTYWEKIVIFYSSFSNLNES